MASSIRKTLLFGIVLFATFTLLVFYLYLNGKTTFADVHQQEKFLHHSESGRLVARSQFNFHHIVEQWIQSDGKTNHSTRRKERLIEDGRVIREAIEYPNGENEDRLSQENKLNQHSKLQTSNHSLHGQSDNHIKPPVSRGDTMLQNHKNISSKRTIQQQVKSAMSSKNESMSSRSTKDLASRSHASAGESNPSLAERSSRNTSKSNDSGTSKSKVADHHVQPSEKLRSTYVKAAKDSKVKPKLRSESTNKSNNVSLKTNSITPQGKALTKRSSKTLVKQAPPKSNNTSKTLDLGHKPPVVHYQYPINNSRGKTIRRSVVVLKTDESELRAPPLVFDKQYSSNKGPNNGVVDYNNDIKYARLPKAVREKLISIQKERLRKVELLREIRQRCQGKKYCLSSVRADERYLQNYCFSKAIQSEKKEGVEINPCQCNLFRTPTIIRGKRVYANTTQSRVALVSLPGSGNTWVRGLLERATGYCTGSMWCDPVLRAKQFCAEGIRADTLVVKNHDATIRWVGEKLPVNSTNLNKPMYHSAIFIHRNPYEATIAEWNRALGFMVRNATNHNRTVAGIGYYNAINVKDQHTVTFGKEAFGMFPTCCCMVNVVVNCTYSCTKPSLTYTQP